VLDQQLVAFAIVAAVITIIPGADMALIARSVLTHGRRAAYVTSLGVCTGLWVHAVASALGLSAVLLTSATLFSAVKLGGAVYLVTLGALSIRRALLVAEPGPRPQGTTAGDARRAFAQGLLSNLLNPKVALFWLAVYAYFLGRLGAVLRRPGVRRALEGVTGALLIGIGGRLAWERR